jgi:hypothetical protein
MKRLLGREEQRTVLTSDTVAVTPANGGGDGSSSSSSNNNSTFQSAIAQLTGRVDLLDRGTSAAVTKYVGDALRVTRMGGGMTIR